MEKSYGPILLTGVNGQVGGELLSVLSALGEVIAPTRDELDLTDEDAIRSVVRSVKPRWIVNPAAYTAVDKAESEPELAFAINRDAVRVLGEEAARIGTPVLHFSTDYVFTGDGTAARSEEDLTGPLGVYGASKLAGELALKASGATSLIFRTSWVYSSRGKNFLLTILRLAREKEELKIVDDQHGAPTWSRDLSRLVEHTIHRVEADAARNESRLVESAQSVAGIYHACNAGSTTWFGFAQEFVRLAQLAEPEQRFAHLVPITSEEYPTPAARPANSRMSMEKLRTKLGFEMPAWEESTRMVVAEVLCEEII
jgi:dTDP-4-dehydrorhamnose reductase